MVENITAPLSTKQVHFLQWDIDNAKLAVQYPTQARHIHFS